MKDMTHDPLVKYIKEARGHGMSDRQIIKALSEAGWHTHEVVDFVLDRKGVESTEDSISVRNVSKSYGKIKALDKVSLNVKRGSVAALLGPNGAGKTTLVRILTTLLPLDTGRASVAGFDVMGEAQKVRTVIGLSGQFAAVDDNLTGRENLEMVGRLYHLDAGSAKTRAQELLLQFELDEASDRLVKTYSGGMRRRLDLSASLVIRPKILFLDEPTAGLDPRSRFALWHVIRDLAENGTTVLLTTQYLEEADQLAHHIFVIDRGHIIAEGTSSELKRQVGGDVLELHIVNREDTARAAELIKQFGEGVPHVDPDTGMLTVPVRGGASVLVEVVRQLDRAQVKLHDIMLRRPSLDDVFMKLTGHEAK